MYIKVLESSKLLAKSINGRINTRLQVESCMLFIRCKANETTIEKVKSKKGSSNRDLQP